MSRRIGLISSLQMKQNSGQSIPTLNKVEIQNAHPGPPGDLQLVVVTVWLQCVRPEVIPRRVALRDEKETRGGLALILGVKNMFDRH